VIPRLRPPSRRPAPRARRRGVGQDARPHGPDRASHPRARRRAVADLRRHVHEQGGGGDARACGRAARRRPARPVDRDLPLAVRAPAAARGRPAGLRAELHDLRSGRLGALHQAPTGAAWALPQGESPARDPRHHFGREEPHGAPGGAGRERRRSARACGGGDLCGPRPGAPPGQRHGLRRPPAVSAHAVRGASGASRILAAPFRSRAGGRIPGYQRRPVPAREAASHGTPEPLRGGRRRPGDLRVARRGRAAHALVSAGLPRYDPHQARAELPLHPGRFSRTSPVRPSSSSSRTTAPPR